MIYHDKDFRRQKRTLWGYIICDRIAVSTMRQKGKVSHGKEEQTDRLV